MALSSINLENFVQFIDFLESTERIAGLSEFDSALLLASHPHPEVYTQLVTTAEKLALEPLHVNEFRYCEFDFEHLSSLISQEGSMSVHEFKSRILTVVKESVCEYINVKLLALLYQRTKFRTAVDKTMLITVNCGENIVSVPAGEC